MERKRDHRAEYQRRKELREQKGLPRDYGLEKERAEIRARARGYSSVREQREYRRTGKPEDKRNLELWRRTKVLTKFGLTKPQFDRIRKENREFVTWYGRQHYNDINTYHMEIDLDIHDWSEDRVGYIVSYHGAIVNPATNYNSLTVRGKNKEGKDYQQRARNPRTGKPITNPEQFYYLTKYTGLFTVNEFEQRYGNRAIQEARQQGGPRP